MATTPSLQASICKLAMAGEEAGFTVEQLIWMLNAGITIESLLNLIEWRLGSLNVPQAAARSSRWVV